MKFLCWQHGAQPLIFCSECVTISGEHRDCNYEKVENIFLKTHAGKLSSAVDRGRLAEQKLRMTSEMCEHTLSCVIEDDLKVRESIMSAFRELLDILNNRHHELLTSASSKTQDKKERLSVQIERLRDLIRKLESARKGVEEISAMTTSPHQFQNGTVVQHQAAVRLARDFYNLLMFTSDAQQSPSTPAAFAGMTFFRPNDTASSHLLKTFGLLGEASQSSFKSPTCAIGGGKAQAYQNITPNPSSMSNSFEQTPSDDDGISTASAVAKTSVGRLTDPTEAGGGMGANSTFSSPYSPDEGQPFSISPPKRNPPIEYMLVWNSSTPTLSASNNLNATSSSSMADRSVQIVAGEPLEISATLLHSHVSSSKGSEFDSLRLCALIEPTNDTGIDQSQPQVTFSKFDSNGGFRISINAQSLGSWILTLQESTLHTSISGSRLFIFACQRELRWGGRGSGASQFSDPMRLTCDEDGNLYVADYKNDRIQVFGFDAIGRPRYIKTIGAGTLNGPRGLALGSHWTYVVDSMDRICTFHRVNDEHSQWGKKGTRSGEFKAPCDIAIDADHAEVIVVDSENMRLQIFSLDTRAFLGEIKLPTIPRGAAIGFGGLLYVTCGSGSIAIFSWKAKGERIWVRSICSQGSAPGQLSAPTGIDVDCMDSRGFIFVADKENRRMQVLRQNGTCAWVWSHSQDEMVVPWGVAFDSHRKVVYLSDSSGYIWTLQLPSLLAAVEGSS